jgi:hypothetical protein
VFRAKPLGLYLFVEAVAQVGRHGAGLGMLGT